jgi:hypothetical protein
MCYWKISYFPFYVSTKLKAVVVKLLGDIDFIKRSIRNFRGQKQDYFRDVYSLDRKT